MFGSKIHRTINTLLHGGRVSVLTRFRVQCRRHGMAMDPALMAGWRTCMSSRIFRRARGASVR